MLTVRCCTASLARISRCSAAISTADKAFVLLPVLVVTDVIDDGDTRCDPEVYRDTVLLGEKVALVISTSGVMGDCTCWTDVDEIDAILADVAAFFCCSSFNRLRFSLASSAFLRLVFPPNSSANILSYKFLYCSKRQLSFPLLQKSIPSCISGANSSCYGSHSYM